MKTSSTKRMLAFWLAVAILGAPTSGAFAAEMVTLQPAVQAEEPATPSAPAAVNIDHIKLQEDTQTITKVTVDGKNQKTVTALAYSAAGDDEKNKIENSQITWSISGSSDGSGVSIAADTGIITVDAKAKADSYTITATPKTATAADVTPGAAKTVKLTVQRAPSVAATVNKVSVDNVDATGQQITLPAGGSKQLSATVLDQYGDPYDLQAAITYTVADGDSKISVSNNNDNKLMASSDAVVGTTTTVTAKCKDTQDTGKTFTVQVTPKQSDAVAIRFVDFQKKVTYTGKKVENPKVQLIDGTNINTNVSYKYEKVTPQSTSSADVSVDSVTDVGTYRVTATYTKGPDTANVSDTFEITPESLTVKDLKVTSRDYKSGDTNVAVTGTLDGLIDVDKDKVTLGLTGKMADDTAGENKTVTVTATLTGEKADNYTVTPPENKVTVTINKIKYAEDGVTDNALADTVSGNKGSTVYGKIPDAMAKLKQTYTVEKENITDTNGILNGDPIINDDSVKIQIKDTASENQTATVPVKVSFQNYEDVTITYTVKVVNKKDVSNNIQFASKTVTYNGQEFQLDKANLDGNVTAGAHPKWTYTKTATKAAESTEMPPKFKDVGVYEVTATYEDDENWGQKTATLKIEAPAPTSSITVTAEQRKGLIDENYKNFSISLRDETNGYVRIRADANDYLDRQKIGDTYSEWIGLEITPKVNGSTSSIENFYVSTNGSSWNKISKGTYGNFYLDGVQGYSFYLWYDTDDKDRADDLYLATDNMGANKFQIHMDFDAYSASSDSGSSGSTSSSTNKVNGDKVSTTTIDKTPSVKGNSATVSISSSALTDALEKNKKESKHEKADKSFIELDVKTSKSVDDTTVTVPVKSLDKISDEDTGLSLVTNQGTIQMDYRALSKIVSAADKNEVSISIEEDKSNQYTLMVKDGSNEIIDLGSGEAELTFSYKLKSGEKASDVKVYRVGDGSKTWLSTYGGSTVYAGTGTYAAATGSYVTNMNADYNSSKKKVTFATDALGTFLVTTDTLQTGGTSTPGTPYPSYPSYPSNSTFVDVPASRWSAQYINKLASLGVVNGTGGGYFEPTLYVTREEFVKMLAGVAGANVSGYTSQRFPDVSASRWSAPYIAWAVDHGITTGTDGGKFAPMMKITREEMATMIYRYTQSAGKVLPTKNVPTVFSDSHMIDSWAQTPVSVMQQAGIIDGNVVNGRYSFDPKVPATREECAKMLCLLYDLI